jgi:hypothetical protein
MRDLRASTCHRRASLAFSSSKALPGTTEDAMARLSAGGISGTTSTTTASTWADQAATVSIALTAPGESS